MSSSATLQLVAVWFLAPTLKAANNLHVPKFNVCVFQILYHLTSQHHLTIPSFLKISLSAIKPVLVCSSSLLGHSLLYIDLFLSLFPELFFTSHFIISLGNLFSPTHIYSSNYHLHKNDSQICISNPDLCVPPP